MGGIASQDRESLRDLVATVDLGPRNAAAFEVNAVCSLESCSTAGHFVRHRASELWADAVVGPDGDVPEANALDASFVLVTGLLGHGCSLRSANFPLEFIRTYGSKLGIGEYDGSQCFRKEATFEMRIATSEIGENLAEECDIVCFMLGISPGMYARVAEDGRVVLEQYYYANRAFFGFRLVPGLAVHWHKDLGEPLVVEAGECEHEEPPRSFSGPAERGSAPDVELDASESKASEQVSYAHVFAVPNPGDKSIEDAARAALLTAESAGHLPVQISAHKGHHHDLQSLRFEAVD